MTPKHIQTAIKKALGLKVRGKEYCVERWFVQQTNNVKFTGTYWLRMFMVIDDIHDYWHAQRESDAKGRQTAVCKEDGMNCD